MDQVDEVKQKTDIVALISEYVELKKAGRNYKALCPFHGEKTPSFMVSPELQIFKCFGCSESGDAIAFLQKYEGMEFGEALEFLADRAGVKLAPFKGAQKGEKERLYEINSLAGKLYQYILLKHPKGKIALEYLKKERGLKQETIETFSLGYSPDVTGALRQFLVNKKKFSPQELDKAGLTYSKNGFQQDRFRGRVVFPLFDHRGNIVGFSARVLPSARQDLAKYINTPETLVYHKSSLLYGLNLAKERIKQKKTAIVVEGQLDMISSYQGGIKNTVAMIGSALTPDQVRLLSRFADRLILALDTDLAGDSAARRGIAIAQNQGLSIKVARIVGYKDPDEAARHDIEGYKKALIGAVGVWDFLIDSVFERFGGKTGEEKAKVSREIIPILADIPDRIVQAHYIEKVAERLVVPQEAVSEQIDHFEEAKKEEKHELEIAFTQPKKSRRQILEERLVSVFIQSDPGRLQDAKVKSKISTPLAKRILEEVDGYLSKKAKFDMAKFAKELPSELSEGFSEMALLDFEGVLADKEKTEAEIKLLLEELEILDAKDELRGLAGEIHRLENSQDKAKLKGAQKRFGAISRKLSELESKKTEGIILREV
jgi:DNA primase